MDSYPFQLEENNPGRIEIERIVRQGTRKEWKDDSKSTAAKISFSRDAAKLWNKAFIAIKNAKTLSSAKSEIKKHCKLMEM